MNARTSLLCVLTCVVLFGAGCVDVQVVATDREHVPAVGQTSYAADTHMSVETRVAKSGHSYTLFRLTKGSVRLKLARPSRDDKNIFLNVPGTYTSPTNTPEGFVVLDGNIIQAKERQAWNGAAFFRADGTISIFETNNGKLLTKEYLKTVESDKASLIQGHLLVHSGIAQSMLPQTPYQRRALAIFRDGSFGVIESTDLMDLSNFARDLPELGVEEAMNLDMGQWSEGWYRSPVNGTVTEIGYLTGSTDKQSNWIIFTAK